jgi:hypothetical protein
MFRIRGNQQSSSLLLEVLMIVVGINVALWFEDWFQDLENAEIEERYLVDLRDDLQNDIDALDQIISSTEKKSERVAKYIELMPELADLPPEEQTVAIYTPAGYQFFEPSDFTYRSMQESGDFRLLRDRDIKKSILKLDRRHKLIALLQSNYLQAVDDVYLPVMMASFDIADMRVSDPSMFEKQIFKNFFAYTKQDTDGMLAQYRLARAESEDLVALIDAVLDE